MDMKKSKTTKCIVLVQIFVLLLSGCGLSAQPNEKKQYTITYLDVFDVSHQCYPHKVLTGRAAAFSAMCLIFFPFCPVFSQH